MNEKEMFEAKRLEALQHMQVGQVVKRYEEYVSYIRRKNSFPAFIISLIVVFVFYYFDVSLPRLLEYICGLIVFFFVFFALLIFERQREEKIGIINRETTSFVDDPFILWTTTNPRKKSDTKLLSQLAFEINAWGRRTWWFKSGVHSLKTVDAFGRWYSDPEHTPAGYRFGLPLRVEGETWVWWGRSAKELQLVQDKLQVGGVTYDHDLTFESSNN